MHFPCWTVCPMYFSGADILSFFSSIPLAWQVNWWQYTPLLVMFPSLVCTVCPCQIASIFPLIIISSWSWWCSRIFQSFRNFIFTWSDKERRLLVEKSNRNNLRLQPSSWKAGGTQVKICLLIFFFSILTLSDGGVKPQVDRSLNCCVFGPCLESSGN